MNGRWVVLLLLTATVVVGSGFWAIGLRTRDNVRREAAEAGLPELSRDEVAERVAREDMFGLPSRLQAPPPRNIERAFTMATAEHPLPATEQGIVDLLSVYAVTIKGCRGMLPPQARELPEIPVWVTVAEVEGQGKVVGVEGYGESERIRGFTACLLGGLQPAVLEKPEGGERTWFAQVSVPR